MYVTLICPSPESVTDTNCLSVTPLVLQSLKTDSNADSVRDINNAAIKDGIGYAGKALILGELALNMPPYSEESEVNSELQDIT